jgi:transcriptional regulator with XRE-family HTH domain
MMDAKRKSLGERIRELREQKDLSLREFGKKLGGKSAAFLSDVELGRRHPSEEVLGEMARILATTLVDLKSYDTRPAVEELKRRVSQNPALGFALRKALEKDVSDEALIRTLQKRGGNTKP